MSHQTEHPDVDVSDVSLPAGWRDESWHNDSCPAWVPAARRAVAPPNPDAEPPQLDVKLWVEDKDPAKRENPGPRFCISLDDYDGGTLGNLYYGDDNAQALAHCALWDAATPLHDALLGQYGSGLDDENITCLHDPLRWAEAHGMLDDIQDRLGVFATPEAMAPIRAALDAIQIPPPRTVIEVTAVLNEYGEAAEDLEDPFGTSPMTSSQRHERYTRARDALYIALTTPKA